MKRVVLTGWKPGLKKVSLADLLKKAPGYNLKLAHEAVNRLMEGGSVEITLEDDQVGTFIEAVESLGAVCKLSD